MVLVGISLRERGVAAVVVVEEERKMSENLGRIWVWDSFGMNLSFFFFNLIFL